MARIESFGIDAIAVQLKEMSALTSQMAQQMLAAGADELKTLWQKEIRAHGHVDTGDMVESVAATEAKKSGDGLMVEVYPQGKDRKGVSNAEKAYLLHYGWKGRRSKIRKSGERGKNARRGDHFVDAIEAAAPDAVEKAMATAMERELKK